MCVCFAHAGYVSLAINPVYASDYVALWDLQALSHSEYATSEHELTLSQSGHLPPVERRGKVPPYKGESTG